MLRHESLCNRQRLFADFKSVDTEIFITVLASMSLLFMLMYLLLFSLFFFIQPSCETPNAPFFPFEASGLTAATVAVCVFAQHAGSFHVALMKERGAASNYSARLCGFVDQPPSSMTLGSKRDFDLVVLDSPGSARETPPPPRIVIKIGT